MIQALRGRWTIVGAAAVAVVVGGLADRRLPDLRTAGVLPVFGVVLVFNVGIAATMTVPDLGGQHPGRPPRSR